MSRSLALAIALLAASALLVGCRTGECDAGEAACDGNSSLNCHASNDSSRWRSEACGERTCVVAQGTTGATALCIASTTVDPRCGPDDFAFCDGAILHSCQMGHITAVTPCGAPDDCIAEASRPSFCRTDAVQEAPCDPASFGETCTTRYGRCYRVSEAGCQAGFSTACVNGLVRETLCPADQSCTHSAECSDDPQIAEFTGSRLVATVTGKRVPATVGP